MGRFAKCCCRERCTWGQACSCWTLQPRFLLCRCNLSKESGLFEYADSKILQLMLSKELNKRLKVGPCPKVN